MQFAIFARVMEWNVGVGSFVAVIDLANVEWFRVNVNADRALIVFWQIQNLMNGFEGIDVSGACGVHFVDVCRSETTGATMLVFRLFSFDAKILNFQAADRRGHPAILTAVIVNSAELADFPADGHTFEDLVLVDQIAGVAALGEEEKLLEGFGPDGVMKDVVLNIFQGEASFRNGG